MDILFHIIALLLIFWLISLIWSQKVAKCVFKFVIYLALIIFLISALYFGYEFFRWGHLLHQLNDQSIKMTELINFPSTSINGN